MRVWIVPACLGLVLAGCAPQPRVDPIVEDTNSCAAAGFAPGSPEMASCLRTAANSRQQEANRQARADESQARRDEAAKQRQAAEDAADQAAWDRRTQQSRDEAAALMSGQQTGFAVPEDDGDDDFNRPTAAGIPGMECEGVGADASCDALSSY